MTRFPTPRKKSWKNAKLFEAYFMDQRFPVCGQRMVWAVVGYKWVRVSTGLQDKKWRMRRADWDQLRAFASSADSTYDLWVTEKSVAFFSD